MAEQSGSAHGEAKEVVQKVACFAKRDAQVSAAIAGEQTRAGPDVGAGQFKIAASLAGPLASKAAMDVASIAMPFELGFGDVGDDVVVEFAGVFEFAAATMGALLRMHFVFDELGVGRRIGPKDAGMLAMFFAALIVGRALARLAFGLGSFATLKKGLELVFELRNPLAQLGVFGFEFRNPLVAWIIHDRHSLPKNAI
jgi:hypothetical protein